MALEDLRFFRFAAAKLDGTEVILSRSGYTGELGYELYTPAEEAGILWAVSYTHLTLPTSDLV